MTDPYLRYRREQDDPRLLPLIDADPVTYVDRLRANPRVDALLSDWERLFASTSFVGVTDAGDVEDGLFEQADEGAPVAGAVAAAEKFLACLDDVRRDAVRHDLNSRVWRAWLNPEIYLHRFGVRLDEASPEVREHALRLLESTLSAEGFAQARRIMRINAHLGDLVHGQGVLNEFSYNVNIFGTPSLTQPWGWQIYGHHLAVNCLFFGPQVVLTPAFLGSEPTHLPGEPPNTALFVPAEKRALELLASLDDVLRARAVLYAAKRDPRMPPGRIAVGDELSLAGAFRDNRVIPYEGARIGDMTPESRAIAAGVVAEMLAYHPPAARAARLTDLARHLDRTYFCWIGGHEPADPFYFRIQGPTILAELDHHAGVFLSNPEPERFHTHTVVRTPNGNDYGVALTSAVTGQRRDLTGL
ncbi:DUF3500 domain-containing protein [Amycolatopsis ultiminotia]|uniref:DUF3500 domain-containing protein n=1 Tax=Amycolatopsis ultiminotia TaxID=543629 RepID=A0ABP6XIP6_9PSEU